MLYAMATTPNIFGRVHADCVNDDTAVVQAALNQGGLVFLPPGRYAVKTLFIPSNTEFFGAGDISELVRYDDSVGNSPEPGSSMYILATNAFDQGSTSPTENKRNICVRDMKIDGRRREFGYQPFSHSVVVSATSHMSFERVHFYDWRGDAIYIGSGTVGGIERHNQHVTVRNCVFDGHELHNRNGISVIDCDGRLFEFNLFKNIGNRSLSSSVGAINFEPNAASAIYRNAVIRHNVFEDISSTNTAAVTLFNGHQVGNNIGNITIEYNKFRRCYRGIASSTVSKTPESPVDKIIVKGNEFSNSILEDLMLGGMRVVRILNNAFWLEPSQSGNYRGGIGIGTALAGKALNAIDWIIEGNIFDGLRPQFGGIAIYGVRGLKIRNNKFYRILGRPVSLVSKATVASGLIPTFGTLCFGRR